MFPLITQPSEKMTNLCRLRIVRSIFGNLFVDLQYFTNGPHAYPFLPHSIGWVDVFSSSQLAFCNPVTGPDRIPV